MSTGKRGGYVGKHKRRARRHGRQLAAATGTVLLVAAAVAGEPGGGPASVVAGGAGGGLHGLTDPDSVSADGKVGEDDRIGDEVLDAAGDINRLRQLGPTSDLPNGPLMIPGDLYKAYTNAATMLATEIPSCHLHWSLLASIGRIESNHARGGQVDAAGNTVPNILGPVLNGGGFAAIRDTDGGRLDGDARWDRAVGTMQFIPSTWQGYASDGNNDGVSSPHNIYDATLAAGKYLCSGGMDLLKPRDRALAVFRYNHSDSYVRTVLIWADAYAKGTHPLPSTPVDPAEIAAMRPPATPPGSANPSKPRPPRPGPSAPPSDSTPPPGSSGPPSTSSTASTTGTPPSSCDTPTSTTTTTPPSSPPSTTTTNPCPPSSTPPSSSASQGSSSVTPTSSASTSEPAGEAGTSVVPTT
ncbi:lytic transglycosylase domain-containing protein [Actinophytocola sp.]|uniref:lytic transglycosylase domain-containing protein n=1 Tax=Actinophytocola sp. TaxID=1872138 RepID=UPI003D6B4B98